jgi:nucleoside-diphosphate-sugar epimerase
MTSAARPRLVILGCGYVGTAVALEGLARGMRVTALTRNTTNAHALRAQGIETVVGDIAGDAWHHEIPGGERVVNCVSSGGGGLEGYRHSYVGGMRSLVAWARGAPEGVGTVVYTSSTSVYPQGGGVTVDESAPTDGAGERGRILLEAERVLQAAGPAVARWFVLRLAGIYGPGRHHLLEQVRAGEVAGAGDHRLNLVHRDDIGRAIWACFDAPAAVGGEIFNVADEAAAPKREVASWLAQRAGVAPPRFTGGLSGSRQAVTPDRVIVSARIRERLGWRPVYRDYRAGYESMLSD